MDVPTIMDDLFLAVASLGAAYVSRKAHRNASRLEENSRRLEILTSAELDKRIRQEVARQLRTESGRALRRSLDAVLGQLDNPAHESE